MDVPPLIFFASTESFSVARSSILVLSHIIGHNVPEHRNFLISTGFFPSLCRVLLMDDTPLDFDFVVRLLDCFNAVFSSPLCQQFLPLDSAVSDYLITLCSHSDPSVSLAARSVCDILISLTSTPS